MSASAVLKLHEAAETKAELKADIADVKAELRRVDSAIELAKRDLTIRLGGMMVVAVGVILAAIRYLPPPHP